MSRLDRKVVRAIAEVPGGEIYKVRELLDYTSNQFNPYRNRLIKSGIITGDVNGIVEFALPWFDEFCKISDE